MNFVALYETRRRVDSLKQPAHSASLASFHLKLLDLPRDQPYQLDTPTRRGFGTTLLGAPVAAPPQQLFRFTGLTALTRRSRGVDVIGGEGEDKLFRTMIGDHQRLLAAAPATAGWLRLADYLVGELDGVRGIDFWTDLPLTTDDLREQAYRLGLPREYHPADPLILRLVLNRASSLHPLRVPTILDGYDHGAFFATVDQQSPAAGHTLDLNEPESLASGVNEFVSGPIPVEDIEFIPVDWRAAWRDPQRLLTDNPVFIQYLIDFFEGTLDG